MTKRDAISQFMESTFATLREVEQSRGGRVDLPFRRQAWNTFVDTLHRDGQITDWQADNWGQPEILETAK